MAKKRSGYEEERSIPRILERGYSVEKGDQIFGHAGKILRVNLCNGEITTEPTLAYAEGWLGGPGIAVKILYDEPPMTWKRSEN